MVARFYGKEAGILGGTILLRISGRPSLGIKKSTTISRAKFVGISVHQIPGDHNYSLQPTSLSSLRSSCAAAELNRQDTQGNGMHAVEALVQKVREYSDAYRAADGQYVLSSIQIPSSMAPSPFTAAEVVAFLR